MIKLFTYEESTLKNHYLAHIIFTNMMALLTGYIFGESKPGRVQNNYHDDVRSNFA